MRFTGAAGLPHSGQNFAPEAIFAPQLGQNVPSATGVEAAGTAAAGAGSGFFSFSSLIRLISASNPAMASNDPLIFAHSSAASSSSCVPASNLAQYSAPSSAFTVSMAVRSVFDFGIEFVDFDHVVGFVANVFGDLAQFIKKTPLSILPIQDLASHLIVFIIAFR